MSLNEVSIKIPGEYIPNVFGQFDAFAKKIERTLHVTLVLRDDSLKIIGAQGNIEGAKEVFEQLIALAGERQRHYRAERKLCTCTFRGA